MQDQDAYNPSPADPLYWDADALQRETFRIFEICHGCRRCFNLCDAFPVLFNRIDMLDGEVQRMTPEDVQRVVELCYQCKVCGFQKCPYTPPHRYRLDFPRLMLRAKALRARHRGIPLRERLMIHVDRLGRLARPMAFLANWANRNPLNRVLLEATLGIHRKKRLPRFHRETFERWFRKRRNGGPRNAPRGQGETVALFFTCQVNYNHPEIGRAAVEVLERNGVRVVCPPQRCCGMPLLDAGDVETAMAHARYNLRGLREAVARGYAIVTPIPTCLLMLKTEYPYLLGSDEAREVADRTRDLSDYLMELHRQGRLSLDFPRQAMETIAYHVPCHLRDLKLGYKARDLMALIPGTRVEVIEQCSAHDGTWSMKREHFERSMKLGSKLFRDVEAVQPHWVATDCPLAGIQIQQGTGRKPLHPIQVLHRAYGLG